MGFLQGIVALLSRGLLDLFFPPSCTGCHQDLVEGEVEICTICFSSFPETDYHMLIDNPITYRLMDHNSTVTYGFALYTLRKKALLNKCFSL